ncbi:MAG: murein peptide amidase A, partial [Gammaproteobacteria bacterium]
MPEWEAATQSYWVTKTNRNPRRYPGKSPLSEPESRWLVEEMESFAPDVIVAVHAPHGVVDYDGPRDGPYKLGRLYLNLLGTFPGSLGNYAGIQRRMPVVTIELPYAGTMPKPGEVAEIWRDLVQWLTRNLPEYRQIAAQQRQDTEPS